MLPTTIDGNTTKLADSTQKFVPAEDITVFELSQILAAVLGVQNAAFSEDMYRTLPTECRRHFKPSSDSLELQKRYLQSLT